MPPGTAPVTNEKLEKFVDDLLVTQFNRIFKGFYKEGPVRREVIFEAGSIEEAIDLFKTYLQNLDKGAFTRVRQLGKVEPFALDLRKEIQKLKEKQS